MACAGEFFTCQQIFQDHTDLAGLAFFRELGHLLGGSDGFVVDLDLIIGGLRTRGGFHDLSTNRCFDLARLQRGAFFARIRHLLTLTVKQATGADLPADTEVIILLAAEVAPLIAHARTAA